MESCSKCGAELIGSKKFCAACGAPVGKDKQSMPPPATSSGLGPNAALPKPDPVLGGAPQPSPQPPQAAARDSAYGAPPPMPATVAAVPPAAPSSSGVMPPPAAGSAPSLQSPQAKTAPPPAYAPPPVPEGSGIQRQPSQPAVSSGAPIPQVGDVHARTGPKGTVAMPQFARMQQGQGPMSSVVSSKPDADPFATTAVRPDPEPSVQNLPRPAAGAPAPAPPAAGPPAQGGPVSPMAVSGMMPNSPVPPNAPAPPHAPVPQAPPPQAAPPAPPAPPAPTPQMVVPTPGPSPFGPVPVGYPGQQPPAPAPPPYGQQPAYGQQPPQAQYGGYPPQPVAPVAPAPGYPPAAPGYGYGQAAPPMAPAFAPGARVWVTWANGQRYPATVQQLAGNQCLVVFPDGQQHWVDVSYVSAY
jgi:hypothetical protein